MRTAASVLCFASIGVGLAGAVTLMIFVLLAALACDLLAETFDV